jgi:hypothetical protein
LQEAAYTQKGCVLVFQKGNKALRGVVFASVEPRGLRFEQERQAGVAFEEFACAAGLNRGGLFVSCGDGCQTACQG